MNPTNPILYPNVTRVPGQSPGMDSPRAPGEAPIQKGEFDQSLEKALKTPQLNPSTQTGSHLDQISSPIKFSAHATQRLRERNIHFDQDMMSRMSDALNKAEAKGVQDTLVLTDKAALIVSVPNRTVITAMDRNNLAGNVFTNIDGAVII